MPQKKQGYAAQADNVGSMLGLFFSDQSVSSFDDAKKCDLEMFSAFYQGMRQRGVYIAPSQFEVLFLSAAHTEEAIDTTVRAAEQVLSELGK